MDPIATTLSPTSEVTCTRGRCALSPAPIGRVRPAGSSPAAGRYGAASPPFRCPRQLPKPFDFNDVHVHVVFVFLSTQVSVRLRRNPVPNRSIIGTATLVTRWDLWRRPSIIHAGYRHVRNRACQWIAPSGSWPGVLVPQRLSWQRRARSGEHAKVSGGADLEPAAPRSLPLAIDTHANACCQMHARIHGARCKKPHVFGPAIADIWISTGRLAHAAAAAFLGRTYHTTILLAFAHTRCGSACFLAMHL